MTILRYGLLISSNQLREKLTNILWQNADIGNKIRVLDASYDFDEQNDGYKDFYQQGHIPSSVYFNHRLCTVSTPTIPFNLPDTNCFTEYIQSLGVSNDTHIVTYDRMDMRAALRAWWMFRLYGHNHISVLDGGLKKWVRDGYAITTEEPQIEKGNFEAKLDQSLMRDFDFIKERFQTKSGQEGTSYDGFKTMVHTEQLVDARGSGGFNKTIETDSGEQKNHIPGAKNLPYSSLFNEDGTFKSVDDLKDEFRKANVDLNHPIIAMCARGVIACGVAAAAELLGKSNIPVYYGSFKEWSKRISE